ncbi:hypothetical protein ACIQVT_11800 [Streptomyces sp. NPDC100445]|uniref:hypothetical protein n=1 Tax=Streptomyces sp. NPDC100445 TaxID=3366102 RepID=UPI003819121A
MADFDVPGVSRGATAVPVFLADFGTAFEGVVRADTWTEFSEAAGEGATSAVTRGVLRGYFENGGGFCYLANTTGMPLQEALTTVEAFDEQNATVTRGESATILLPLDL